MKLDIEKTLRGVRVANAENPRQWAAEKTITKALGQFIQGRYDEFGLSFSVLHSQKKPCDPNATDYEWWGQWLLQHADKFGIEIREN